MPEKTTGAFVRAFALALPNTEEREHMGSTSFRVSGKIFAQLDVGESIALVKMSLAEQQDFVSAHPDRFRLPPHWAKFGWTYVRLDDIAEDQMRELIERSWRRIAPKAMAKALPTELG